MIVDEKYSRSDYLKYHITIREEFNPFLSGGRLLQQWLLDNYVKIEKDRLQYLRTAINIYRFYKKYEAAISRFRGNCRKT